MVDRTRVLVVDDEPIVRDGLSKIFSHESDIIAIGVSSDADAVDKVQSLQPDVVLLDIIMPRVNGLQILPMIKEKLPKTKVIMLSVSDREEDLFSALRLGAQGYLLKSSSVDQILDGVRRASAGETVLSPQMVGRLASEMRVKDNQRKLSSRETQILEFLYEGLSNTEIAGRLSLEESTVKTHVHHLLSKLRVKNRTEAVFFAKRHLV